MVMHRFTRMACLAACVAASAQKPPMLLQVAVPEPADFDLRGLLPAALLPVDRLDQTGLARAEAAWQPLLAPFAAAPSVRLLLPGGPERIQLLLAASRALRSMNQQIKIFVAFQPEFGPVLDELAWGAVDGGALLAADLGAEPQAWRRLLVEGQRLFPGQPWYLWAPVDPGPRLAQLLGDGGRLVLADTDGPGVRLARELPAGLAEVEGGLGDLTLRGPAAAPAWRRLYQNGAWVPAPVPAARSEVQVLDQDRYDLGALLAKVRATQLRDGLALRTVQCSLDLNLHIQAEIGGGDLGFRFRSFQRLGGPEELLRKEVLFNGVRARVAGNAQLPVVEAESGVAAPVALTLTERYRYSDGGAPGPGQRGIVFRPVDRDPQLFEGELVVDEATGRILQERSQRSNLRGVVRNEQRLLTYGEPAPGLWRVLRVHAAESWIGATGNVQVLRDLTYDQFACNAPGFDGELTAARAGDGSILQNTPEGFRYFVKQADGSRKLQTQPTSAGRAIGGVLLVQPGSDLPVLPLAGYFLFDFNALGKGIQYTLLTAGVFNAGSLLVPRAWLGLDLAASGTLSLLSQTERPVENGRQLDQDGVDRRAQRLRLGLGREIGAGLRLDLKGQFDYDRFSATSTAKYRTPDFQSPPSGWTTLLGPELTWRHEGFQLRGGYAQGTRPDGAYGLASALQAVPRQGQLERWDATARYDRSLGHGAWVTLSLGHAGGRGFDRFEPISLDGRVAGIKPYAVVADRLSYGGLNLILPTGPNLRLTLGLDHGQAHSLTDQRSYGFTGLKVAGDLPGFGWFSTIRVDLGAGLHSDVSGVTTLSGMVSFLHLF